MRFDYKAHHIECRARHDEDGQFYAQARITRGSETPEDAIDTHESGDLDGFDNASDALACARSWAIEWCDAWSAEKAR
jgi:hypothetical protein